MSLGPVEIGLIVLVVMLLFGYKKLPDASRSLARSLRIFKSEVDDLCPPRTRRPVTGSTSRQRAT
jgi:sec-independent protein translocase protein TatA